MENTGPSSPMNAPADGGSGLPPGYVWVYQAPPEPERPRRTPKWVILLTAAWAAALLVSGLLYALHGKATVREQTTIVAAQSTVDRAAGNVITAAGAGPVIAIEPFAKERDCDITPVRSGESWARLLHVYGAPGAESPLLYTIAKGLPTGYRAKAGPGHILDLNADAGDYVGVIGAVPSPGDIKIRIATGCRPVGGKVPVATAPTDPELVPVRAVLSRLGLIATSTGAAQIPCPGAGAGVIRTVSAHVDHAPHGSLKTRLPDVATDAETSTDNTIAYHAGGHDMVVTQDSRGITVSAITRCA